LGVLQGIQLNYTAPASSMEVSENVTTTEAPYVITQQELLRIVRRNLRGLARIFNMESRKAIEVGLWTLLTLVRAEGLTTVNRKNVVTSSPKLSS
jgi:hypothetical protein